MRDRCQYLRTKMDYVAHAASVPSSTDAPVSASQKNFWCLRTMKPLGPDAAPVDETLCVIGRDCFVTEGGE